MRLIDQWMEARRNRAVYKDLQSLGDRLLDDIGVDHRDLENLRRGRGFRSR